MFCPRFSPAPRSGECFWDVKSHQEQKTEGGSNQLSRQHGALCSACDLVPAPEVWLMLLGRGVPQGAGNGRRQQPVVRATQRTM
ncbi:hypothetical protein NDU88_003108 [Pleurodeles waltl]|uniref:Uncharacterized protein n=1 Tax=Pleurodeles waltl TaxID=8319 RepID=A0AAV7T465_PLEWA|nr:hypothetical protein NDU88_003108 [Pleurodeles waltl]